MEQIKVLVDASSFEADVNDLLEAVRECPLDDHQRQLIAWHLQRDETINTMFDQLQVPAAGSALTVRVVMRPAYLKFIRALRHGADAAMQALQSLTHREAGDARH